MTTAPGSAPAADADALRNAVAAATSNAAALQVCLEDLNARNPGDHHLNQAALKARLCVEQLKHWTARQAQPGKP